MIFGWLKRRRRERLQAAPFPESWNAILHDNVIHERQLTAEQRARLRRLISVFVAQKNWEGCGGLILTDEIRVTIAAQACLLVVGMSSDIFFDHVFSILVYPHGYIAPNVQVGRAGIVIDGRQPRLGEAWYRGPVILSWSDALAGGRMETPGHNLVLHEFAHQLDMLNGRLVDGTPRLEDNAQLRRWARVMEPEFKRLVEDCRYGRPGFIDCYGATNEAEFFAVLTEAFFEQPVLLQRHHRELYDLLQGYYRLDPAEWTLHAQP
ncbi:MAG: zinc-dependent peptidase [Planctomycetales bacterium]|nr:zinc-dependent peptidase [Planctomycetales bacterium]